MTSSVDVRNGNRKCVAPLKRVHSAAYLRFLQAAWEEWIAQGGEGEAFPAVWPVRTLRIRNEEEVWQPRTPVMAAGLADHVWSLEEWLAFPAFQST